MRRQVRESVRVDGHVVVDHERAQADRWVLRVESDMIRGVWVAA
ncbi:hypothetical protein ACFWF7_43990 [Nocardia sp. NPDC060256]